MTDGDVLELLLAAASEVFGRPVAAQDNFFDLGGDSLTAIELGSRVEDGLGAVIDLDALLAADTFAQLAAEWAAGSGVFAASEPAVGDAVGPAARWA